MIWSINSYVRRYYHRTVIFNFTNKLRVVYETGTHNQKTGSVQTYVRKLSVGRLNPYLELGCG